jgi:hypothetical protein
MLSMRDCSVIMLSQNISHPPRRVCHAGQASESRRQLVGLYAAQGFSGQDVQFDANEGAGCGVEDAVGRCGASEALPDVAP